jgi:PAS domain S-box-containing protein
MSATSLSPSGQGAVIAYRDITERKQLEQKLQESEVRYRTLFERAKEGIFYLSTDGTIPFVNEAFARMHGYSVEEMQCINLKELDTPPCAALAPERIRRLLAGEALTFETEHYHQDGHVFPLEVSASLITVDGKCLIQCFHRDLTERKEAETEKARREELNRQLQKSESLSRMAGAIAHHFNNQLQVVMLELELAASNRSGTAEAAQGLSTAMQATRTAAEVSNQMLTYLGQSQVGHEPQNLAEICRQSLELLKSALPPSMVLETDLPSPGPGVHGNASQIKQVLMNLFTNAWEASGDGWSAIRLSVKTASTAEILAADHFPLDWQPQAAAYACLEVTDAGAGISAAEIGKIFDPFYSTKFTGRGLGLSIVLGIARSHGGVVTVKSETGRGSVFRVFFPAVAEAVPAKLVPVQLAPAPSNGGGRTVLVVEDEPTLRQTLALALESHDFNVLAAGDGVEAMELFRQHRDEIDCVLCDVVMPRMDGWVTLAALRQIAPQIPVIMVSGYDEPQRIRGDHPVRPQAFLKKPFDLQACINTVRLLTTPQA